jgi:pimeloyl-ACP methyl ester carboxylesterase
MRYVLVHGAFGGKWIWEPLTRELEAQGHHVEAIDLPGCGDDDTPLERITLDAYTRCVCAALRRQPEPAVLVGHSMGGMVITQAAARCPEQVAAMVYVCAFLPQDGQSLLDLTQLPEGADDQVQANMVVEGDPPVARMPNEAARTAVFGRCSDETAQWALERRGPQAVVPFTQPVQLEGTDLEAIPRRYVFCADDRSIPPPLQRRMVREAGVSDVAELDTDHAPMLSTTADLARILVA